MQAVVCREYPEVAQALDALNTYGPARMSGSGACVFCGFETEAEARNVFEQVSATFEAYCVAGLPQHPLLQMG